MVTPQHDEPTPHLCKTRQEAAPKCLHNCQASEGTGATGALNGKYVPAWVSCMADIRTTCYCTCSIILETGIRSEDDLTHKMVDIIRVNQRLKESKEAGTPPLIVQDLVDLLQYHSTTYFDNEVSGIPQAHHRSGRPLKTLTQRL